MEIGDGVRQRLEGIVNLVIHDGLLVRKVLQGDAAPGQKGHLPVAVEGAARIHADSHGTDLGILVPSHAEEVAHRAFHGRMGLIVPIDAQDQIPPAPLRRQPDMTDHTRALDIGHLKDAPAFDADAGIHLPAHAQIPARMAGDSLLRRAHAALPRLSGIILRADGA